ncbi:MAG: restriction endonuclease subunit S [Acidimicrobiaceae bacterium]|nr:restriction endonuclease subunit S [Acidimicrobiaceae bacterium]
MTLRRPPAEIIEESNSPLVQIADWWERCELGQVAEVTNGAAFKSALFNKSSDGLPLIRIRDVGKTETSVHYSGDYDPRHIVERGDLVVGMDGDFRVARWTGDRALLNQRVCRLRVLDHSRYSDRFLEFVLQPYLDEIHKVTSSVTVKHLSSRTVQQLPIPLPPRSEQDRIVAAIEEHFSRLDAIEAVTASTHRRLDALQDITMDRAFCDAEATHTVEIGELAEVSGGIQKQPKRRPRENRYPFLRVANVGRGQLDLAEVHEVELFEGEIDRFRLERGDLLVVEGNGSANQIGRAALWGGEIDDCVHQNHIIRVRPGDEVLPEYLALCWNAPRTAERVRAIASSTSGLYTLSTSKVKSVGIPLVPLSNQRRTVERLGMQLSGIEQARAAASKAQARFLALRRSILSQAFAGRLVSQSPSDEPASVMLERIGAGT